MLERAFMRRPLGVILLTTTCLAACLLDEAPPDVGTTAQAITGNVSQGNVSQGNVSQGVEDAVYGFRTTGWRNNGMKLKNAGVASGHLVAQWDRTDACTGPINTSPSRTCSWQTPGSATCAGGTLVSVRAGGCASGTRSMTRICAGGKACTHAQAIKTLDAACVGATNPPVTFTCPTSGRYFVALERIVAEGTQHPLQPYVAPPPVDNEEMRSGPRLPAIVRAEGPAPT